MSYLSYISSFAPSDAMERLLAGVAPDPYARLSVCRFGEDEETYGDEDGDGVSDSVQGGGGGGSNGGSPHDAENNPPEAPSGGGGTTGPGAGGPSVGGGGGGGGDDNDDGGGGSNGGGGGGGSGGGGSPHDAENNPPEAPSGGGGGGGGGSTSSAPTTPTGSPVGTDPGQQTPDNTIPAGTDPATLPDGEYYDAAGNHVIVSSDSNGNTHVRPSGEPESGYYQRPDGTTNYAFNQPGQGGYVAPPPPPPPQDSANWGNSPQDPTGTLPPPPPPPTWTDLATAGGTGPADLKRHTDWLEEAYSQLSEDTSVREQQLGYIAAVVEQMAGQWTALPSGKEQTLLGPDGRRITAAQYFTRLRAAALHNHSQTKTQIARTNEFAKAWAATDVTSKASTDALKAQFPEYSKGIDDAIVSAYLNHIAGEEETLPPGPDVAQATLAAQVSQERAEFNRAFKEFTGQEATGDMATDRSFVQNLLNQVEESDGFEAPARAIRPDPEQTTASAEFNRFRNEVSAAYAAPDVVDDEGFSTNVNAHQHTKGTLQQLKSQYADDPAKTAFLDGAIKQLDVHYDLHSLGTDARAGKAVAVLAEQERRLKAQAVELGKVGTLEDIAQESGLAGTTEYRVWLADEKKYATLTGREMQDMGVSNVLHDPWSQEARDLAAQGQNVLVERAVEPAAAKVKDDPGKAAAMANFAQHMLQFAAADSGGASTVVSMMKSAEELAKESPAFAALPADEQRKLLDHYDNPVKNPYTRAAALAAASGMAGSIASGTAFGSTLLGQAALGVPFAAADVGGTYLDTGKVTWKDGARAALFESLPFIPDVGTAVWKGGKHGVRSFATGGDFTDWAHGNVDSTVRINLQDLSKSIPEGFTPQGGSIADNAVFAYGSPGGLKPKTVTEIQQEFGQSVQAQLFDLAGDNPGKTVSVRLPDGRFITYTPPRAAALQSSGNPLVFAASPDVGFVKDGSYVTMPLPLEKIEKAPVEASHFGSLIGPLKRFRRSSANKVAGDSGSRGSVARALFGEPSNPGVIAYSKFDAAGAPNVALSGKVYQPAHGPPVIEIEGVKDINLPTAVPYQYGIGMPQVRSGGLVTGYDQPKLLSSVQFAAGDVRQANLGGLVDQYGRFLPSGLRDRIGVRDVGIKITPNADAKALARDWTPTQVSLLGDGQEFSNIAKLHLERRYLLEMGVPEGDLPSSPSPLFNPRTRKYDDPVNEGLSAPGRLHDRSDPDHPDGQRAGGSGDDDGPVGSQQDNGLNRADADVDGDGIPNRADPDVDGDGIPNRADSDVDGDGIPNRADSDVDGDGIPNRADADVDGDGIPNRADSDVDGDGIPNRADSDVDGDGIPNRADPDVDGDGIPNRADPDVDGDGIPNRADPDVDGDGIPNRADSDVDGDGIPNRADSDVDGDGIPNRADADVDATLSRRDGDFDSTSRPVRSVIDVPLGSPVLRTPDDMMGHPPLRVPEPPAGDPPLRVPEPPAGDPPLRVPEPPPGDPPLRVPESPPGDLPLRVPEPPPGDPTLRVPEPPPGDPPLRVPEPPPGDPPVRVPEPPPGDPPVRIPEPPPPPPPPSPPPTPPRKSKDDPIEGKHLELRNPYREEDGIYPREVQWIDHTVHTLDVVDGEHTIEPLSDQQLRTVAIKSFSNDDPEGNVHLAGSLQLESFSDHIALQAKRRRRGAEAPAVNLRDVKKEGDKTVAKSKAAKSAGKIGYRPGQGLAAQPAANEGVLTGNGGKRRRGGGSRRRPEDEEETGPPQINLVFNPRG